MSTSDREHPGPEERSGLLPSAGLPTTALGLRLLALAAVAGSSAFLPIEGRPRALIAAGILIGALLGLAHFLVITRRLRVPGECFVVAQLAVWTALVELSGGQRSPLFLGYLLEVPLTAVLMSRRGCVLAAVGGAAAYLIAAAWLDPPLDPSRAAIAIGFIAVTALLTSMLIEVLERQRRQIESSQRALRARAENLAEELRLLGDYLGGALVGLDDLGRVVSLNRAGEELLGVSRPSAVGRAWLEVMELDSESRGAVLRTLSEGVAQRGLRLVLERPDGRTVLLEGELWVNPTPHGRTTWLLLGTPAHEPGNPDDPVRRLGEAVACVSHQIKNSLHALQGFAHEIEHEIEHGAARESTGDFQRALRSLGQLADDVLAMSGGSRPSDESVRLRDVLSTAIVLARSPSVQVRIVPGPDPEVRAHRGQLVHALFNLIDNACRVSPAGHVVEIRIDESNDHMVLEIRDGGPGMPAGMARLERPVPSRKGNGYGLLATRRFLEANHGELSFEPLAGGGTVSRIALRRVPPEPEAAVSGLR